MDERDLHSVFGQPVWAAMRGAGPAGGGGGVPVVEQYDADPRGTQARGRGQARVSRR